MSETRETKIRRLRMRSMRRGIKEMDLILQSFAAERLEGMSEAALDHYDSLLNENDQLLYAWVSGREAGPAQFADLLAEIAAHARSGVARPT